MAPVGTEPLDGVIRCRKLCGDQRVFLVGWRKRKAELERLRREEKLEEELGESAEPVVQPEADGASGDDDGLNVSRESTVEPCRASNPPHQSLVTPCETRSWYCS